MLGFTYPYAKTHDSLSTFILVLSEFVIWLKRDLLPRPTTLSFDLYLRVHSTSISNNSSELVHQDISWVIIYCFCTQITRKSWTKKYTTCHSYKLMQIMEFILTGSAKNTYLSVWRLALYIKQRQLPISCNRCRV